jgi:hypothetical protein
MYPEQGGPSLEQSLLARLTLLSNKHVYLVILMWLKPRKTLALHKVYLWKFPAFLRTVIG